MASPELQPELPIHAVLADLQAALERSPGAVLAAPPGSGKTTIVPLALRDAPWLAGRRILVLEPRRLAVRACANRMAELLGERPGQQVGYQVRFERRSGAATRIEVLTEGILTRRLQSDPELDGVGLLVFDEFHERSLHADLGLALALEVQAALRPDLRILVMSATLDTAGTADLLGGVPVIEGRGRTFPVTLSYADRTPLRPDLGQAATAVRTALRERTGDILVFLPGAAEIRRLQQDLETSCPRDTRVLPLFGELDSAAQDAALRARAGQRRVVLATDIAETSLTIEGVHTVVDLGWHRQPRFDPNRGVSRLETVRVSRASAEQRAGRAGRLGPGVCYRLWQGQDHAALAARAAPEILTADLAQLVLELARWGSRDRLALSWADPPPAAAWEQARELLQELGALRADGSITATGAGMVALGTHPRLAHLLQTGAARGHAATAADLAALLSERDPLRPAPGLPRAADIELRMQALADWRAGRRAGLRAAGFDSRALPHLARAAQQYRRRLDENAPRDPALDTGGLLALAYPDRVARRRSGSDGRYRLASGRGARLPADDALAVREWLVVAQLDASQREGRIFLAAALDLADVRRLFADRIVEQDRLDWDAARGMVVARREERLGALLLAAHPVEGDDPDAVCAALCNGIRAAGLQTLPWTAATEQLRARVAACHAWHPDDAWPDWSDSALGDGLDDWLAPYLAGMRRLEDLKRLDLAMILGNLLGHARRRDLDRLAPATVQVPSGRVHRLDYGDPEAPVLAVQLQELFGLAETPRVDDGRRPLLLHLLSPARRAVQVTRDLRGFWEQTYAEVRRELRIRYAKHHWPEDPWTARPTAHPRRRRGK